MKLCLKRKSICEFKCNSDFSYNGTSFFCQIFPYIGAGNSTTEQVYTIMNYCFFTMCNFLVLSVCSEIFMNVHWYSTERCAWCSAFIEYNLPKAIWLNDHCKCKILLALMLCEYSMTNKHFQHS